MIRTERLVLRRARMADLEDLHLVLSDPAAMRYWSTLPHQKLEQSERFLREMVTASPEHSDDFVVEREGRVIGKAGCWQQDEVGFILHPDHWGLGLGFEAMNAAIPHIFASLPVDRLTADADPRNEASLRLLAKLGFRETGRAARTIQLGAEWCDSVYLELLRQS